jgi:CD109 antigen
MTDDLDQLADEYVHGLMPFEARNRFERALAADPAYRLALAAARRRLLALELARPEEPSADVLAGRVMGDVTGMVVASERVAVRRQRMLRWLWGSVAAVVLFLAFLHVHYATLAANPIDLEVLGQDELAAGSEASVRVRLTDRGRPLTGVPVEINLESSAGDRSVVLARFATDANGTASPKFALPDWAAGDYRLSITAQSPGSDERIEQPIKLRRTARVMLSTDKPVYQPGQTIRMRCLAVRGHDNRPLAGQPALITVTDPKGNLIFKRAGEASRFGLFAADCELADEINEGLYRIMAKVGETESSLAVDVRSYVLPKFKIEVVLDKPYFKPDEVVRGRIAVQYFHGEPVSGQAKLGWSGTDGLLVAPVREGAARFQIDPPKAAGDDDSSWDASLTVQVTDSAGQRHERTLPVPLARHDLVISAVAQDGALVVGKRTRLLFRVLTPDGQPVAAVLSSPEFDQPLRTDATGWASMEHTPKTGAYVATVTAQTADGRTGRREVRFAVESPTNGRVLTTDKPRYTGGETMTLIALGQDGLLFVDFLRDGQTVRTESMTVRGGRGELAFDLPADWSGAIDMRAYAPGDRGRSALSRRVAIVPVQQLRVSGGVQPPIPSALGGWALGMPHRPGERARLVLELQSPTGQPVIGAVSLAAVDESVFSVYRGRSGAESQPRPAMKEPDAQFLSEIGNGGTEQNSGRDRPFSLVRTTLEEKEAAVEAEQTKGHLRTMLGWAALVLFGLGYACYAVWERAPKAVSLLLAVGCVPGIGSAILIAGCHQRKSPNARLRADAEGAATAKMARPIFDRGHRPSFGIAPAESPRIRSYFPETLLWKPELVTDADGRVILDFDFADSITSWQFTASAVTADGRLGGWRQDVRVTQPFFVDVNLPASLTRNDSISVPVVVSNYLKGRQTIRVELADADWYTRTGDAVREVELAEGEVKAVEFRVKVTRAGRHPLNITAKAATFADAVRRDVTVVPDGHPVEVVTNGSLNRPATVPLNLPADAIDGSARASLKLYPSGFGQLVEGLDGIFQVPHGCFEQTSSTTYPNVLALEYLKRHGKAAPEIEEKARDYVHRGYQRLLTFEVDGGGFDWYGHGPANRALTAYGLMEFRDMARVRDVDPRLIERTRDWLLRQRRTDGSWEADWDPTHRGDRGETGAYRATAYIAWAAFQGNVDESQRTREYLRRRAPDDIKDPYLLALVCNALLATGDDAAPYLRRLADIHRTSPDGQLVWWELDRSERTAFYGSGIGGDVETTALAVLAFSAAKGYPHLSGKALAWIAKQRGGTGTWGSTQATVLALKALVANTTPVVEERRFEVRLDGRVVKSLTVPADQADVLQQFDLTPLLRTGTQNLEVRELTAGATSFQVTMRHHVPRVEKPKDSTAFGINLAFDRDKVSVGDVVHVTASVWNRGTEVSPMTMVELPLPAGFALADDLSKLVGDRQIDRAEVRGSRAVLYVRGLEPGKVSEVTYRLRAIVAARVTVPAARVYEYYTPDRAAESDPKVVEVTPK